MSIEILSISSDNLVRLDLLTNTSTGAYINNAAVTFTLKDSTGAVFGGQSNVSMTNVSGQNGRYEGTLPNTVALVLDALYTLEVTAVGAGYTLFRKLSCKAKYRSDK